MQTPTPTAEHERLALLEDRWEGDERIHPTPFDPEGEVAGDTLRFRLEHSPDGPEWLTFLDGEYRRAGGRTTAAAPS